MTYHHHQNLQNMFHVCRVVPSHHHRKNYRLRQVLCHLVIANLDALLIKLIFHLTIIQMIFMVQVHNPVLHMNLYTNQLILDHRHNYLAIIPCTLVMDLLHLLSPKERSLQLRKYVKIIILIPSL